MKHAKRVVKSAARSLSLHIWTSPLKPVIDRVVAPAVGACGRISGISLGSQWPVPTWNSRHRGANEALTASLAQQAETRAIEHIVRRTNKATIDSIESQARAVNTAARLAFSAQVDSQLARLTAALQRASERIDRPWEQWLAYLAMSFASAAVTWVVASSMAFKC